MLVYSNRHAIVIPIFAIRHEKFSRDTLLCMVHIA